MTRKSFEEAFVEGVSPDDNGRKLRELSLSELEGVSGGKLDTTQEKLLRMVVSKSKNYDNSTIEDTVNLVSSYYDEYFSKFPNVRRFDIWCWIVNHWDEI